MKNKAGLLGVAVALVLVAVALEVLRQIVSHRSGDAAELLLGIEIFVWIFAGVALLRRQRLTD